MNTKDYADEDFVELEKVVSELPRDIRPGRDLWPEIHDRMQVTEGRVGSRMNWWNSPIVSAASIAVAASALTFALMKPGPLDQSRPADTSAQSASAMLDAGFLANRKRLENKLEGRLTELSPEMQGLVRQNLASIRGSLNEISMALASDPDNADLQDLLLSTYEQELQVMTEISSMPEVPGRRIDL
ncbi:MAG: hypothetical protein HKN59_06980 [Gammaproteobacteria bacterium]|nr:hypothetical protein [Gammaproteobacteria bacterium]